MDDIMKQWQEWQTEELLPELEPYVEESGILGRQLRHPLVYAIPLVLPGQANAMYRQKIESLERAKAEGDWHSFVFLHERPYRFGALKEVPIVDWRLISDVWTDSENIWQHYDEWVELFREPWSELLMEDDEMARLKELPETVTIYRGATLGLNEDGLSWTLLHERAEWFAKRLARTDEERVVIKATVPRKKIVAYLDHRGEEEVIVLPEDITVVEYEQEID